jgi:hypothetical protein
MNNQARQHLYQLINDYGIDVAKDVRRLEALLKDYTQGQYKREVFLCVQAAREGVIDTLLNNKHLPYDTVAARLTKQLHEDYGLDLQAAKWAVGSWVVVLGLTNKFSPPKPPAIKSPPNAVNPTPVQTQALINPSPIKQHKKNTGVQKFIASRYLDEGNGTVVDAQTGLHWMRCALGQIWNNKINTTEAKRYTWLETFNAAEDLNKTGGFAGYQDWRVPSIDELKTIVERSKKPAINHIIFPATPLSLFWSCSTADHIEQAAWAVYFYGGSAYWYGKTSYYYLRLVRD